MYLCDRDLKHAVQRSHLIVNPPPMKYDTTGIDLHLDAIEEAKVWDLAHFQRDQDNGGQEAVLGFSTVRYMQFAEKYLLPIPAEDEMPGSLVSRDGNRVILKPGGFFLWQTREEVGTPKEDARYICFINGKSTRARCGLVVHLTAPTIHAGWWGKVTLELANLGPFSLALEEGDSVAQIVVAMISSPPEQVKIAKGVDVGQASVSGKAGKSEKPVRKRKKPS